MGRERAPLDDQRWNDALRKKVMADLERRLDENERELEEAENRRLLKLKLMGISHGGGLEEEEQRRHGHRHNKKTGTERKLEKRNKMARESLFRPTADIVTQMEILHRDETRLKRRSSSDCSGGGVDHKDDENNNIHTSDGVQASGEADFNSEKSNPDGTQDQSDGDVKNSPESERRYHVTNQHLHKLFQEEDLRELYREAENLLRLSRKAKK